MKLLIDSYKGKYIEGNFKTVSNDMSGFKMTEIQKIIKTKKINPFRFIKKI